MRIPRDQQRTYPVGADKLVEPAEKVLFAALEIATATSPSSIDAFFDKLLPLIPAISKFFEDVLVMAEDQALRENRLGMLQKIAGLAKGLADFSKLEGF